MVLGSGSRAHPAYIPRRVVGDHLILCCAVYPFGLGNLITQQRQSALRFRWSGSAAAGWCAAFPSIRRQLPPGYAAGGSAARRSLAGARICRAVASLAGDDMARFCPFYLEVSWLGLLTWASEVQRDNSRPAYAGSAHRGTRQGRDAAYCSALIWKFSHFLSRSACFGDRLSIRCGAASASATPGISRIGAVTALL